MPRYAFGPFVLDTEARLLSRDAEPIPLVGRAIDTLIYLVKERGRLIDKDELLAHVWAGTLVEEANLSQAISTIRKLLGDNPKERRFVATIAGRGYQFVAPVTQLPAAPPASAVDAPATTAAGAARRWPRLTLLFISVAAAVAALLFFMARRAPKPAIALVERRLTFNSSANDVFSAALSPDGKYLTYSDANGIHLKLLSTGEERLISSPGLTAANSSIFVDGWFSNGTEILAHSTQLGKPDRLWTLSAMGQSSRQLREGAANGSVSPDGSLIAFGVAGQGAVTPEIWMMDGHGEHARKILGFSQNQVAWSVRWSPGGERLAYIHAAPGHQSLETCDLNGQHRTTVIANPGRGQWVRSLVWLPDGRILFSRAEAEGLDANLWQIRVNPKTGVPRDSPERITRWRQCDVLGLSSSSDGSRLILQRITFPSQIFIGDLNAGPKRSPERFVNDEANDWATAWTSDSKAVLFVSDRTGKWGLYKQPLEQSIAEPLVEGRDQLTLPRLSPNGEFVIFAETVGTSASRRQQLMRVPVSGGIPEAVFDMPEWDDYECARSPANLCVMIEPHNGELNMVSFDPSKGKGKLLRVFHTDGNSRYSHSLSPDGSLMAITSSALPDIRIRLLSLTGKADNEIHVKGWPNIESMEWSLDGKGLYVGSSSPQSGTLLYVDLAGNVRVLWQSKDVGGGGFIAGVPSPDGHYIALTGALRKSNIWSLEGF
jgi:DNA-binding winged helix-turn-helix (wHTH) protein/Tol biopolymer transport system component